MSMTKDLRRKTIRAFVMVTMKTGTSEEIVRSRRIKGVKMANSVLGRFDAAVVIEAENPQDLKKNNLRNGRTTFQRSSHRDLHINLLPTNHNITLITPVKKGTKMTMDPLFISCAYKSQLQPSLLKFHQNIFYFWKQFKVRKIKPRTRSLS